MFISRKKKYLINNNFGDKKNSLKFIFFLCKKYSIFNFNESVDLSIKFSKDFIKLKKILKFSLNFPYNIHKFKQVFILVDGYYEFLARNLGYYWVGLLNLQSNFYLNNFKIFITIEKYYNYINEFINKSISKNFDFTVIKSYEFKSYLLNLNLIDINIKTNKYFSLNLSIGKVNFNINYLEENFKYFINKLKNIKSDFNINKNIVNKVYISTTMGASYILKLEKQFLI